LPAINVSAPGASVPSEDAIDAEASLHGLRSHERNILETIRQHEETIRGHEAALTQLRSQYTRVRKHLYGRFKAEQIRHDNAKLVQFQAGCTPLSKRPTLREVDAQAKCLQSESKGVDDSPLGQLMRRHLFTPPVAPAHCAAFRQVRFRQLNASERACVATAGDATWGQTGLEVRRGGAGQGGQEGQGGDEGGGGNGGGGGGSNTGGGGRGSNTSGGGGSAPASPVGCGRRWADTGEARCLLSGKDILFIGNSVTRRQMFTMLDILAGPRAHRQLQNLTDVWLPEYRGEPEVIRSSWIWDQNNDTVG
jgi:hypothetical protein